MKALITGVAGFVGSNIARELIRRGDVVDGCDSFTDYYPRAVKQANVRSLASSSSFRMFEMPLQEFCAQHKMAEYDVVFHQAGQPGVRGSWANGLPEYVEQNISATNALLAACAAGRVRSPRVIYASSSSVYGNADVYPVSESALPRPFSPYGVTKLAAEHLCMAYSSNSNLDAIALRYFTVFGPGQRPDMAMHRLILSALTGVPFPLYGNGDQIRDFTFVSDVVSANLAAADAVAPPAERVLNICGGSQTSLAEVIEFVGAAVGTAPIIEQRGSQMGDVARTGGDSARARKLLGWAPQVAVDAGIAAQVEWMRSFIV